MAHTDYTGKLEVNEPREITQSFNTEFMGPVGTPPTKNRAAWVGVVLTALSMMVVSIIYVTTTFASTKAWAAEEDQATQATMKEHIKEDYVQKVDYIKDITVLDERQQQIKKDVGDIKDILKEIQSYIHENQDNRRDTRRRNND